jgi:hypothetical protein
LGKRTEDNILEDENGKANIKNHIMGKDFGKSRLE